LNRIPINKSTKGEIIFIYITSSREKIIGNRKTLSWGIKQIYEHNVVYFSEEKEWYIWQKMVHLKKIKGWEVVLKNMIIRMDNLLENLNSNI